MNMKRMLTIVLAAALLVVFAACGKTQTPAETTAALTAATAAALQTEQEVEMETGPDPETVIETTVPDNWEKATEEEPWKVALAEDLFAKYGVLPEYYEDLGDGIYQVYVEVGGEIVPFVAVNSATGDYHG